MYIKKELKKPHIILLLIDMKTKSIFCQQLLVFFSF